MITREDVSMALALLLWVLSSIPLMFLFNDFFYGLGASVALAFISYEFFSKWLDIVFPKSNSN